MRVLCSSTSGFGHWMPLVPVGRALIDAGHEVRFAAPASSADAIRERGFTVEAFDDVSALASQQERFERALQSGDPAKVEAVVMLGFGLVYPTAALPELSRTMDEFQPELVIRDPGEFASRVLAQRAGIPSVAAMGGLQGGLAFFSALVAEPLQELRTQQGLPNESPPLDDALILTATPESFDTPGDPGGPPVARYRVDVPRDVQPAADPPLVYATVGTEVFRQGDELGNSLVSRIGEAVADLPVRCLLTVGVLPAGGLPDLPGNVSVKEFADHREIVPSASVIVSHGGSGTVQDALLMGRPLVVLPQFADQFVNAARVTEVGVGIGLVGAEQTAEAIAEATSRALDGEFATAVDSIATEAASLPVLPDRVRELEELAAAT